MKERTRQTEIAQGHVALDQELVVFVQSQLQQSEAYKRPWRPADHKRLLDAKLLTERRRVERIRQKLQQ